MNFRDEHFKYLIVKYSHRISEQLVPVFVNLGRAIWSRTPSEFFLEEMSTSWQTLSTKVRVPYFSMLKWQAIGMRDRSFMN